MKHTLPDEVRARLALSDDELITANLLARRANRFVDVRVVNVETRENDDGTRGVVGYATTWDTWYDVAGGAPWGWAETIARGSATKSLAEHDDVRFLINHDGIAGARSRGLGIDTMQLTADDIGLRFDIPSLDVVRNPFMAALCSAIDRGDLDQCSFAFQPTRQEWNSDYTERRILELRLFDVSAVTYPANEATIIGARSVAVSSGERRGMPLSLALAQAASIR